MITETRKMELMRETIQEALNSVPENNQPHPKVGALLVGADGNIKYRAHRGEEEKGGNAESACSKRSSAMLSTPKIALSSSPSSPARGAVKIKSHARSA